MTKDVRVVLADDSPTVRHYLSSIMTELPGIRVVGQARDGREALAMVQELRPDVVSMDISMPLMDGLEATRTIMEKVPTPVVVVSGLLDSDIQLSMRALEAGALAVVEKPPHRKSPQFDEKRNHLLKTLRAMAGVSVVSRRIHRNLDEDSQEFPVIKIKTGRLSRPEVVGIGASTGGPSALHKILLELPANFGAPILIVQHMPHEFLSGLAKWLQASTPLQVKIAESGDKLENGRVYIAPGYAHMTLKRDDGQLYIRLLEEPENTPYKPSVNMLFESLAAICGSNAMGIILTGMGDDGARGLLAMRQVGARTYAQDEETSTVFGMPHAAIEFGAVEKTVALSGLASEIIKLI